MIRKVLFLAVLISGSMSVFAQTNRAYVGLGANYSNFQDARFSDQRINGNVFKLNLGFDRITDKSYIYIQANARAGRNPVPNLADEQVTILGINTGIGLMRNLRMEGFYIGASWDVFDYTIRETEILANNSNFFLRSGDILASARLVKPVSDGLTVEIGADMGIISIMKYAPSFATNLPQNIIDNGLVSFQDGSIRDPLSLQYMVIKSILDQTYLKWSITAHFKKRLSIGYDWKVRSFSDFEEHPLTMANHSLVLRYHFIKRTK